MSDHDPRTVTENTPLLRGHDDIEAVSRSSSATRTVSDQPPPLSTSRRITIVASVAALFFILCIGQYILSTPTVQALELALCRRMYPEVFAGAAVPFGPASPSLCKTVDVQAALSSLHGWKESLDMVPGLLTGVSYGYLAERWGKQWVLSLALCGAVIASYWNLVVYFFSDYIPIELCVLGPLFTFIGGGGSVATAMILSTIASVTPDAHRASVFMCIGAVTRITLIIANPIAYFLLQRGVVFAMVTGNVILTIGFLASLAIPEAAPIPATLPFTLSALHPSQLSSDAASAARKLTATLRDITLAYPQVGLLLVAELATILNSSSQTMIIVQYISKRYDWTFAQAGLVVSAEAGVALFLLLVVFPALGFWLTNFRGLSVMQKDLWIARVAISAQMVGAVVIGLAPSVKVLALGATMTAVGSGFQFVSHSLMTSFMQGEEIGVLFTIIVTLDTIGGIVFSPLVAYMFNFGLRFGPAWYGLPYLMAGVLCALSAYLVFRVHVPASISKQVDKNDSGEE